MTLDVRSLGYAAAQSASDHADRVSGELLWSKIAWVMFLRYLVDHRGKCFTTEQVRVWAEQTKGMSEPPDARAWGNITRKAAAKNLIHPAGYVKSPRKVCHGRDVQQWRAP